jgi:hypothetical protein
MDVLICYYEWLAGCVGLTDCHPSLILIARYIYARMSKNPLVNDVNICIFTEEYLQCCVYKQEGLLESMESDNFNYFCII